MAKILKRYCKHCGEPFFVVTREHQGAKMYCCESCAYEAKKMRWKRRSRYHYIPVAPHEITCKKCGNTFLGRWNAGYCKDCLQDGSEYMSKLLRNRTVPV
jgi:hypothetical protein